MFTWRMHSEPNGSGSMLASSCNWTDVQCNTVMDIASQYSRVQTKPLDQVDSHHCLLASSLRRHSSGFIQGFIRNRVKRRYMWKNPCAFINNKKIIIIIFASFNDELFIIIICSPGCWSGLGVCSGSLASRQSVSH